MCCAQGEHSVHKTCRRYFLQARLKRVSGYNNLVTPRNSSPIASSFFLVQQVREEFPGDRKLYSLQRLFSLSNGGSELRHWGWACDQGTNTTSRRRGRRQTLGAIPNRSPVEVGESAADACLKCVCAAKQREVPKIGKAPSPGGGVNGVAFAKICPVQINCTGRSLHPLWSNRSSSPGDGVSWRRTRRFSN